MSLGIYPVFEPQLEGTKFEALGESLASNFEALERIAKSADLTPLLAFTDNRPIPEGFEGDPDDLAELMGESNEWFEPIDGRLALQALIDLIETNPKVAKRLDGFDGVLEELEELARVLEVAASEGVRFRLEIA